MFDHQSGEFLQIEDAHIYYELTGPPQGHPLLLLHGGLGSIEDFSKIAKLLPESFRIYAIDLRGHGRSTLGTKQLTYQRHQSDMQALVAHLGLEKYTLLGFSDGGIVGYWLAAGNPAVRALVTIGSQWRISRDDPSFDILGGLTPAIWAEMVPDAPKKYAFLNPQGSFDKLVESCVGLWTDLGPTGYPQERIFHINCPVLVLRGDSDFLFSLREAAEIQARISGASFGNIPFAGHDALNDAPEIIGKLIHSFLLNPKKMQMGT